MIYNKGLSVFCLVSDPDVFYLSNKNHRYYCHKYDFDYNYSLKIHNLNKYIINQTFILFITENIFFIEYQNILDFIEKDQILTISIDSTIDNNFFLISSCSSGAKFIKRYITKQDIVSILDQEDIPISDILNYKGIYKFPNLFKIGYEQYIKYSTLKNNIPILDMSNIEKEKKLKILYGLNKEMGIV